ncbi:hypothetical protein [Ottowia sp.]|uniref:hypothetical protein n=1 Tax=Ottowia sp. TaxID=1898956 RepID=UPI0025CBB43D|nr:hypothetical protein [Ottowia sp.]MBK6616626.1 hypothetical protein [Ottowia sp.]
MTKVFKTEVRSDCEAGGLPEAVVFEIDLAAAQLIGRLARLVTENALHLVEKFDSTARFLVLADGHEPVATELGKLRVSATEFWFSAYLKHTTVLVLSERLPLDKLAEAFGPDLDGIAAELLAPAVSADAHTDDRRLEPEFDAARWLAQASDEDVLLLARCQWGGDYSCGRRCGVHG